MFTKSRKVVALALASTVALTGVAIAGTTGADLNDANVVGKVTPNKLDKKKFKPVALFLGVENSPDSTGNEDANAAAENIKISDNVKVNLKNTPICTTELENGTPTDVARDICPNGSYIGKGDAEVYGPGAFCSPPQVDPCVGAEPVVSVFHGPEQDELQLHTYDPGLGAASPVVDAAIVKANKKGYGQALDVPNAPTTGALKITKFNAELFKDSKVAKARCKPKEIKFLRKVTYHDDSSETAKLTQKCKVK